jgi:hypothetical protein
LERNAGERGLAVVAEGDEDADSDLLGGGKKMDVEVEGGKFDSLVI